MLLATFTTLFFTGLSVWLVGHYFQYKGVAAIGATFILIAGSAIALTGLVHEAGHVEVVTNETGGNQTRVVEETYEPVEFGGIDTTGALGALGLGGLVMALSAVLFGQTLAEDI